MMHFLHLRVPELTMPWVKRMQRGLLLSALLLNTLFALAQESPSITMKLDQARITEAMQEIENSTNYRFFYDAGLIDPAGLVSLSLNNATLDEALKAVFAGTQISWEIEGRFIVLKKDTREQQPEGTRRIRGSVTDEDGEPLYGVTIFIKGTTTGIISGMDGRYELLVPEKGGQLVFRYIGMHEEEITINDQKEVNVVMHPDVIGLEEVVAIGYGVQKKRDLTGAVSVVNVDEMKKNTVTGVGEALQGQISGISVVTSGDPGSMSEVRIRGVGSFSNVGPLYVIDGMILNDANHLNPADIESIQVLKDASAAAIYGARGANGVIIITTKKGKDGEARVNFSAKYGVEELARKIDMMGSEEWLYYNELSYINSGAEWLGRPEIGQEIPNTDWQKAIFEAGRMADYNFDITGGNTKDRYMIGGGYYTRDGVLKGPWYDRYSFRVNSESSRGRFRFGENLTGYRTNQKITNTGTSSFTNALSMPPVIPVYDPEEISGRGGYGYGSVKYPTYSTNPVAQQESIDDIINHNRIVGNIFAELEIFKGLKYKVNLGMDYWYGKRKSIDLGVTKRYLSVETRWDNKLWEVRDERMTLLNEHTLTYEYTAGKHSFNALLGFTTEQNKYNYLANEGYNQLVDGLWQIDLVAVQNNMWGSEQENAMISYLGRIDYNYDQKYLAQVNFRRDGSSKFGPDTRWGNFPSASLGWRVSNESFFEPLKTLVSDLKLRGSYGVLGDMQTLGNYDYLASINHNGPYEGYYAVLGTDQSVREGALQSNRVNPYLKWETRTTANVGIDFGMFGNRLYGTIEYFNSISTDLLVSLPLAMATGVGVDPYLGDANEWTNYGEMQNTGLEVSLGWRKSEGDFHYDIFGNFSTIKNEVLLLGSAEGYREGWYNQVNRTEEGRSVAEFYLIETDGIFQSMDEVLSYTTEVLNETSGEMETVLIQPNAKPGDIRYVDFNNDGKIDLDDRQWMGSPLPKLTMGLNFSASYRGFDATLFLTGVYGNKIFNGLRISMESMDGPTNMPADFEPWTWDNPSETTPRPVFGTTDNAKAQTDRWLEDGSYLRIKNLQLGYTFPDRLLKKTHFLGNLRVYLSGQNLFTLTRYKGYDPELTNNSVFVKGCDLGGYPPVRSYLAGIEVLF